jgi:hypothetical protein
VRDPSPADDKLAVLQESKPLVTRAGAWHTWNDALHIRPGQEKHRLRLTLLNGVDARPKFSDLRVQLARKPFATIKDFEGADSVSFDLTDKLTPGNTAITVEGFGPSGGRLQWKLFVQRPSITGVKPNPASEADDIKVEGVNFSEQVNQVKVLVGSKQAKLLSAAGTELTLKLPPHLPGGNQELVVTVKAVQSKPFTLAVKSGPRITWVDFVASSPGQPISLSGSGFSPVASENIVTFGNIKARVVSASESRITCIIPEMRFPQWHVPIVVTTNGLRSKDKASINVDLLVIPNEGIPMR